MQGCFQLLYSAGDDLSSYLENACGLWWYLRRTFIVTDFSPRPQINSMFNAARISLCQQMTFICSKTPQDRFTLEEMNNSSWNVLI